MKLTLRIDINENGSIKDFRSELITYFKKRPNLPKEIIREAMRMAEEEDARQSVSILVVKKLAYMVGKQFCGES